MDAMRDEDIILLTLAVFVGTLLIVFRLCDRFRLRSIGRINVKKKYRFQQVIENGGLLKLSPVVIAETNRFRDVERIRNTPTIIPPGMTVAVVFEAEGLNA